ncbi:hypothetical protein [Nonomuraea typhae]|uniref:hypothetical protein n=1 Tax=Nonomuraea typhae TaxID=2603600 RepID=UPI0012FBB588|nr:hypothetical protein [Nonomuraea typhae]
MPRPAPICAQLAPACRSATTASRVSSSASAGSGLGARLRAADAALTIAIQVDGMLGVDARLNPRGRERATVRFGARLTAVLDGSGSQNELVP